MTYCSKYRKRNPLENRIGCIILATVALILDKSLAWAPVRVQHSGPPKCGHYRYGHRSKVPRAWFSALCTSEVDIESDTEYIGTTTLQNTAEGVQETERAVRTPRIKKPRPDDSEAAKAAAEEAKEIARLDKERKKAEAKEERAKARAAKKPKKLSAREKTGLNYMEDGEVAQ
jgi:hypothetical protein